MWLNPPPPDDLEDLSVDDIKDFINDHELLFIAEQNKDGQMKTLLSAELEVDPGKFASILNYDGHPITAAHIVTQIEEHLTVKNLISELL